MNSQTMQFGTAAELDIYNTEGSKPGRTLTRRVGEDALRIGRLVLKARQHLVEPLVAQLGQEPLDVGPRQPTICVEAEAGVLHHDSAAHLQCKRDEEAVARG